MSVDSKHPDYVSSLAEWQLIADVGGGEAEIKRLGKKYLPATEGMVLDGLGTGQPGAIAYEAYLSRAVFPNYFGDGVETCLGMMHREDAQITVPERMRPMLDSITPDGESALMLLRRMNEAQLRSGRIGLLLDVPTAAAGAEVLPYVATYCAESIINWDDGTRSQGKQSLELVVLDEKGWERDADFQWAEVEKWRVLARSGVAATIDSAEQDAPASGEFMVAVADKEVGLSALDFSAPMLRGRTLDFIPFVFLNARDLLPTPDRPPMSELARLCLAIYRGEADRRQALYRQGQDTLVVIGAEDGGLEGGGGANVTTDAAGNSYAASDGTRIGAGSRLDVPLNGDAKFIGVSGSGLTEARLCIESDREQAASLAAKVLEGTDGNQQSGAALRIRVGSRTASLHQIALASAEALQQLLRWAAVWLGYSDAEVESVVVEPNLDFSEQHMAPREVLELVQAKQAGAPLSWRSVHSLFRERGVTLLSYEEEVDEIAGEVSPGGDGLGVPDEPGAGSGGAV